MQGTKETLQVVLSACLELRTSMKACTIQEDSKIQASKLVSMATSALNLAKKLGHEHGYALALEMLVAAQIVEGCGNAEFWADKENNLMKAQQTAKQVCYFVTRHYLTGDSLVMYRWHCVL